MAAAAEIPANEAVLRIRSSAEAVRAGVAERIVGLDDVLEHILITVFTGSHALVEGVPGLAKTLLLSTVAELLDLEFSRIQFTPDLMPSDITGSEFLHQDPATGERLFRFSPGPVFANLVLADEINRAPPKTQAALMEAMEEGQVTSLGVSRRLEAPFVVLATQNPIEQEGTYPLPKAQLDRFLFKVRIDYPDREHEAQIARLVSRPWPEPLAPVVDRETLLELTRAIARLEVPSEVASHAVRLVQASRPQAEEAPEVVREYVEWGAGPRAAQSLALAARARAALRGRERAEIEDVRAVAPGVLRHRLVLSYAAEADSVGADGLVRAILRHVAGPDGEAEAPRASWLRRALAALWTPPVPRRRSA